MSWFSKNLPNRLIFIKLASLTGWSSQNWSVLLAGFHKTGWSDWFFRMPTPWANLGNYSILDLTGPIMFTFYKNGKSGLGPQFLFSTLTGWCSLVLVTMLWRTKKIIYIFFYMEVMFVSFWFCLGFKFYHFWQIRESLNSWDQDLFYLNIVFPFWVEMNCFHPPSLEVLTKTISWIKRFKIKD